MPTRTLTSTLAVLFGFLAFGCKPDCRLVCEKAEEADCFNADDVPDCEYACKHDQDLVRNAGCESDYEELLVCLDELEDICDAVLEPCTTGQSCKDPKCDNEADDLRDCVAKYCTRHPRNNECTVTSSPTGA